MRNGEMPEVSAADLADEVGLVSSGLGINGISSLLSPLGAIGSASYSTASSALSGMTYFLVDYLLEPIDVIGTVDVQKGCSRVS